MVRTAVSRGRRERRVGLLLLGGVLVVAGTVAAQDTSRYRARLSVLPVDFVTTATISGSGEVTAALDGERLVVSGTFAGLSSPATVAHVHLGAKGRRGPVAFVLEVTAAREGKITGEHLLDEKLCAALADEGLYVQIQSENNPEGEVRGWLLRQPPRSPDGCG